jgi:F-type H+-transporting ATPase subunit a
MHPVSISAEKVFTLFGVLPVTNSLLTTWLVMVILIAIGFLTTRKMRLVPQGLQNVFETIVEVFLGLIESVTGDKKQAREFFAYAFTIFLFILFSNWMGLIPGVGAIGFFESAKEVAKEGAHEVVAEGHGGGFFPLFRAGSSDLSFTLALAMATVIYVQYIGFKHLHLGYLKKYLNFSGPIQFFVGILEIISEFAKIVSFSFRLFGNIFAGEVLLLVMTFLVPYLVPIPFYGLEIFVGLIQALVFMMLTLVFLNGATASHEGH